jgi:hypothetical protein
MGGALATTPFSKEEGKWKGPLIVLLASAPAIIIIPAIIAILKYAKKL